MTRTPLPSECRRRSWISCSCCCEEPWTGGQLSFRTLQRIAGKCMSMTVAIRPASLLTHGMFAVIAYIEKSGRCTVELTQDSRAYL